MVDESKHRSTIGSNWNHGESWQQDIWIAFMFGMRLLPSSLSQRNSYSPIVQLFLVWADHENPWIRFGAGFKRHRWDQTTLQYLGQRPLQWSIYTKDATTTSRDRATNLSRSVRRRFWRRLWHSQIQGIRHRLCIESMSRHAVWGVNGITEKASGCRC